MEKPKILIYVIVYNNEKHIIDVLDSIPIDEIERFSWDYEVVISDDCSQDLAVKLIEKYLKNLKNKNFKFVAQKRNLGYGGNQKFGFNYALVNNFDALVLIHGDGQYSPLLIPDMIKPIFDSGFDCVLGSRMIKKTDALRGKMPLYKFIGNIVLTFIQNCLLRQRLSEYHTGLRSYKVSCLKDLPYNFNADGFPFDSDILIQLIDQNKKIFEIPIPTYYGTQISNVNVFKYGTMILLNTFFSRLQKLKLVKFKKFDYKNSKNLL